MCLLTEIRDRPHISAFAKIRACPFGGGGWPCPFLKDVKMEKKKKRKKKKKKKETKNANSIDTMLDRNFHFVSQTEGEIHTQFVLTRLCLAGGGPGRCLEGSVPVKTGKSKRANITTPTRHLPVFPNAFDIDFTWRLPLSFPMFLEVQVRRAAVKFSRRAGTSKGAKGARLEKKVPGSCNRFQA